MPLDQPAGPEATKADATAGAPVRHGPLARLRSSRRTRAVLTATLVLLVLAVAGLWYHFAGQESTDDAQIDAHISPVAARVGGTVVQVLVRDNQPVQEGTLLVRIDPRDYQVALDRAEADLAENEAAARAARTSVPLTSTTTSAQEKAVASELAGTEARLAAAWANLREAEARERQASQDAERLRLLVDKDEVSQQQFDLAKTTADSARAASEAARASVHAAEKAVDAARSRLDQARTGGDQVRIMSARAASADAKVQMARAAVERARLDLAYTEVRAPVAGIVSRRTAEIGQVVQAGQPLLALVALDDVWVTANFKESQLRGIRPGMPVSIAVDAYGGRAYRGHVDSIAAATGSRFSLLPPENATGNFVKVVQRVPIKIVFEPGQDEAHLLRPGLSVVPTVHIR